MEDFQPSKPIYLQLADRINRKMVRNELKPGEKLPSVREMALDAQLNPNTVQRTYSELERLGTVETKRGRGTFVTEKLERLEKLREELACQYYDTFVQSMKEMGFDHEKIIKGLEMYMKERE